MIEAGLRAAGRRTGLVHLAAPAGAHRAHPHRRPARSRRSSSPPPSPRARGRRGACCATAALDMHPTYFETVTAMALVVFREAGAECAVLEVGLGGRLDATNVVAARRGGGHARGFRPRGAARQEPGSDRGGEGRHSEARRSGGVRAAAAGGGARARRARRGAGRARAAHPRVAGPRPGARPRAAAGSSPGRAARSAVRWPASTRWRTRWRPPLPGRAGHPGAQPSRRASPRRAGPAAWSASAAAPDIILDGAHNPAGARALAAYIDRFYAGPPHLDDLRRHARQGHRGGERNPVPAGAAA